MRAYATLGDIVHAGALAGALLYVGCVLYFTRPGRGFFDEEWKRDGFCIRNKDVPFRSSFDACLYVDTIFSLVLLAMWMRWKKDPGMERANELVPFVVAGTLVHGISHGVVAAFTFRSPPDEGAEAEDSVTENNLLSQLLVAGIFWFPLLKAMMVKVSSSTVAVLAGLAAYGSSHMKRHSGFTYVQTVLVVAFHASQLLLPREEKERREHLTLPLVAAVPPLVTAWSEALFCKAYYKAMGGHVLYDASIILCFIGFYADCHRYARKLGKEK